MVGHLCRRKKHTLAIFMGTGIIIIVIRALSRLRDLMLIMIHTPSSFQLFFIYLSLYSRLLLEVSGSFISCASSSFQLTFFSLGFVGTVRHRVHLAPHVT